MANLMSVMHEDLKAITQKAASLSQADRDDAERRVKLYQSRVDKQSGFVQALLSLSCMPDANVATFCSIVFKNTVKQCWNAATAEHCIQDGDKAHVRKSIPFTAVLTNRVPPVHRNLIEAMRIIAEVDFPLAWPDALNDIISMLDAHYDTTISGGGGGAEGGTRDVQSNIGADANCSVPSSDSANGVESSDVQTHVSIRCAAMSAAHCILAKYRAVTEMSEEYVRQLRVIYSVLLVRLLRGMTMLLDVCEQSSNVTLATLACSGLVSAVDCVLDMTSLDLGDEFISNMDTIVALFLRCLGMRIPAFSTAPPSSSTTSATAVSAEQQQQQSAHDAATAQPLIAVRSIVTSCVTHFLNNFDEDFEKYATQFLRVIWDMLADPASQSTSMDDLVVCGLELLSSACRGTTRAAFASPDVMHNLVQQVILPNLRLRDTDVDDFAHEPEAYVQHDIEGSDLHTRRRAAGELLRALVVAAPAVARPLLTDEVARVLAAAATDWRAKDLAIYFASSLAVEGQHVDAQRGATRQLGTLVPFDAFLHDMILPELASPASEASPLLVKADCIRVIASFRTHLDVSLFDRVLACLQVWLASDSYVVVTYAAHALTRLLLVPQAGQSASPETRYVVTEELFAPHAAATLQHLCLAVQQPEHSSNAYLVQCLLRVCQRVPGCVTPYVGDVVMRMNAVLAAAAVNPSNPLFSHCLFEVLSRCIAMAPQHVPAMEQALWNSIVYILANDVTEYVPYTLQMLAQLLRTRARIDGVTGGGSSSGNGNDAGGGVAKSDNAATASPPSAYQGLLQPLLEPGMYEQRGNIPAIVCLLTAFVECYPGFVIAHDATSKLLNIVAYLIRQKNYDHEGFNLLTYMLLHYPAASLDVYMVQMLRIIVERLQRARTAKYVRVVILFISMMIVVRGPAAVVRQLNEVQDGLFFMFLQRVWLPNVQKVTGDLERKTCIVALTRLLCESAELQASEGGVAWANSVYSCLRMIHGEVAQDDHVSFTPPTSTLHDLAAQHHRQQKLEEVGYSNSFIPLQEAALKPIDVCYNVPDAGMYFRQHLIELLRGHGASLLPVLQSSLTPDLLALIQ